MAARPRVEHSYYVGRLGRNWVGYWYVREDGERLKRQRVIGAFKTITKTEAEKRHAAWVRENVPAYGALPERATLQTVWDRHIARMRDLMNKGKRHPKYVGTLPSLFEYLRPWAEMEPSAITPEEIEPLFDAMKSTKTGKAPLPETKGHIRNLLRTLLKAGGSAALKESKMRLPGRNKGETLSKEQMRALRGKMVNDRDLLIFDTFAFTGLRAGEARRVAKIHLRTQGILETPGTKTDFAGLPIPVPSDVYVRLLRLPAVNDRDPILFEQESHRTWLEEVLQPAWLECQKATEATEFMQIDTRMLRRTVLTFMREMDKGAASRLARHADSSMMDKVYDNADLARVSAAQDLIFEQVTKKPRVS